MEKKDKKKKKEKIRYIDDGRTISDMSGVHDRMAWAKKGTVSPPREIWRTYWNAVKLMFLPMLVFIGCLALIYLIITIVFHLSLLF